MCVCMYVKTKKKGEENSNRETMDVTLRMLGRPDLAKYVTRNRNVKSFDVIVNDDISKGQSHSISKRNLYKNMEEESVGKEKGKSEKVKDNCTNQVHENQHTVSSTEGKKTSYVCLYCIIHCYIFIIYLFLYSLSYIIVKKNRPMK